MGHRERALDNPINWSFPVGRLFGIEIRVHVLFLLGAVVVLLHAFRSAGQGAWLSGLTHGVGSLAILFGIVLLHEFGHCFGARRVGGQASEILLWPLGGLASVSTPHTARANLITAVAGPAVNVAICALVGVLLILLTGSLGAVPWNPFNTGTALAHGSSAVHLWLVILFQISYVILLFNLAPVFPLDGGRVLQCVLWPAKGYAEATRIATGVGMVGAILFAVLGLVSGATILFFIAVFGYLTCWRQRQMLKMGAFDHENEFGYDFSQGYTSLDQETRPQRRPGFLARRRAARAAKRELREQQQLDEHRRRVDAILDKIARQGAGSLTPEERRILQTETERQRAIDE